MVNLLSQKILSRSTVTMLPKTKQHSNTTNKTKQTNKQKEKKLHKQDICVH